MKRCKELSRKAPGRKHAAYIPLQYSSIICVWYVIGVAFSCLPGRIKSFRSGSGATDAKMLGSTATAARRNGWLLLVSAWNESKQSACWTCLNAERRFVTWLFLLWDRRVVFRNVETTNATRSYSRHVGQHKVLNVHFRKKRRGHYLYNNNEWIHQRDVFKRQRTGTSWILPYQRVGAIIKNCEYFTLTTSSADYRFPTEFPRSSKKKVNFKIGQITASCCLYFVANRREFALANILWH